LAEGQERLDRGRARRELHHLLDGLVGLPFGELFLSLGDGLIGLHVGPRRARRENEPAPTRTSRAPNLFFFIFTVNPL
jgi:hypothetical protein